MNPKQFFDSNLSDLEGVVQVVRAGFGRNLDFEDIYNHVTNPKEVYLFREDKIKAMASYQSQVFGGLKALIVEGVAMLPEVQGNGLFKTMTSFAVKDNNLVCLRTQNPRMYRALQKICRDVIPSVNNFSSSENPTVLDLANYFGCKVDEKCVVRGYYGGLFYGKEPTHCEISKFFRDDLKMDLCKGDAVLAVGFR